MSFRGDDSRRYGHVPPAQYPVANQAHDPAVYPPRRPSFNTGDDSGFADSGTARTQLGHPSNTGRANEELFVTSPGDAYGPQGRPNYATPNPAMAGYQHQYQSQAAQVPSTPTRSTYNPQNFQQNFPRTPSTSLPYHPATRYSPSSPTYAPQAAAAAGVSYTPVQSYNPAAYANTGSPQRQQSVSGYSGYSYAYNSPPANHAPTFSPVAASAPAQLGYGPAPVAAAYGQVLPGTPSTATAAQDPLSATFPPQQYVSYPTNGMKSGTNPDHAMNTPQPPYPAYTQIPVGPNYSASDPNSFMNRPSRSNSQESSSPVILHQPSTGLQRHPTNAPLPNRPMEDVAEEPDWDQDQQVDCADFGPSTQESLMNDIVSDLGASASPQRPRPLNGNMSDDDMERLRRYDSVASTINTGADGSGVHRFASDASTINRNDQRTPHGYEDDDSDPEAAAGLRAMEEAALDDRRFSTLPTFPYVDQPAMPQLPTPVEEQESTDSDFGGMDLGMYGGGYAGNLQYGNDLASPPPTSSTYDGGHPSSASQEHSGEPPYPLYSEASVDYGDTGGLQPPQIHRLSFDEGDEEVSVHSRLSGSESPAKEDYPDMFYHPGISNRPLPALPPGSDTSSLLSARTPSHNHYQHGYSLSADSRTLYYPQSQDTYHGQVMNQQHVERSISLSSHSSTPLVQAPTRSRTDAADERRKALKQMTQPQQQPGADGYETETPPSMAVYDMITLPSGRQRKFIPSKLTAADINRCAEPWALSGITNWVRDMTEGELYLTRKTIEDGIVKLFSAKVPTMNVADAEALSTMAVDTMFAAGILLPEEEWVKVGSGTITGVLWQLTGSGCYSPKVHENEAQAPRLPENGIPARCYSHHCGRTLKKANLDDLMSEEEIHVVTWDEFYGVTQAEVDKKSKKERERQYVLHEIVTGEEEYMNQLDVLRLLYRDQLRAWQPPIITANRLEKFIDAVFGKVDAVQQVNKEYLLAQLKYRQKEKGPWIPGFSDLFREWIRKARPVYIDFCSAYPHAAYLIRREADRNLLFRQFLDIVRDHKRSKRLEWTTFIKAPITRLQRYGLLLETAKKHMVGESEEKTNLNKALEEIKAVTFECDEKVAEMSRKVALLELQSMLVLRPGFQSVLNLDHLGRQLLREGDLQRQGSKGVRWVDTHALLFDHYFVLAKAVFAKEGRGDKKYDVSKEPIPMPLLFLESKDEDPVSKQKGLTAPLGRTSATTTSSTQLNKAASNGVDRPGLEHTVTSSSMTSLSAASRLTPSLSNDPEGKIIYPFRIKHLGHEVYTLYSTSYQDRNEWCNAIIEAKTRHAQALHAQNAEPFRLRMISDGAFVYDSVTAMAKQPGVAIHGTPLDRAIREMERTYGKGRGPPPVCRAQVNCACAFSAYNKSIIAIGTDYGVYISEASNPRGWTRTVQISKVTQIAVLEEFSTCLIIADRSLVAYPLDVVAPVSNFPAPGQDNPRRAPQRLAKDVTFFATARMKDRMLLFYKRREGMHSIFKVLEPVFQRASEKKSRLFGGRGKGGGGTTETFRDFDEFYLPTECYSLNLFQSYIAVASAKGFELLTLDKKFPQSIPSDLSLPAIANIASRIRDQRPLGMFKLNDQEFLLTYEDCAVYVDKHGEISRTLIMEYSGKQKKAKVATMYGQYLILFNEDYVEVRNAENGRLRQIIAGRDVRCLDFGFRGPTGGLVPGTPIGPGISPATVPPSQDSKGTVKICMSHPEVPGGQIVLEMLLNDGHAEAKTKDTPQM